MWLSKVNRIFICLPRLIVPYDAKMCLKLTTTANTSIYVHIFAQYLRPNPPPLWRNETRRFTWWAKNFQRFKNLQSHHVNAIKILKLVINIGQGPPVSNDNYAL